MPTNNLVSVSNIYFELQSLNYEQKGNSVGNFEVKSTQNVNVDNCNKDYFDLIAFRKLEFVPNSLFEIKITLRIRYAINASETDDKFLDNHELMKSHILEHLNEFYAVSYADAYFSNIISQITSWFGKVPLVLPGVMNFEGELQKEDTK